ncbi:uncharacterized protein LOC118203044, partial [Stegodyphus dumicola]|uniref:uncharacterized protein LOC118203044 n=1 Tax=Stegodyphus dumicola TaxID=202533 RepID=UPI0015B08259
MNIIVDDKFISTQLKQFWELEALEIEHGKESSEIHNDILENFDRTIKFKEKRYEVKFQWNENSSELKMNYVNAEARLNKLVKRLANDPLLHKQYQSVIKQHLKMNIAEEINQSSEETGRIYYMPHQPVTRPDKPLRILFDAFSHSENEYSLNDCLYFGPNLNSPLLKILMQFRTHNIVLTANIEYTFLQISLSPEDRDAEKFLRANDLTDKDGKPNTK